MIAEHGDRLICRARGAAGLEFFGTYTVDEIFAVNGTCTLMERPGKLFPQELFEVAPTPPEVVDVAW